MSDDLKGKSSKVKVMYVRNEDNTRQRTGNPRTGKGGHSPSRQQEPGRRQEEKSRSPWRTVSRAPSEAPLKPQPDTGVRNIVDPEVIRKQRQEETRVYGENACQALFQSRPESIVRAWFIQSVTPRFRETLRWLAANRKAYHVVEDAELVKASGTDHHGGVCFIIKKHMGQSVSEWLEQAAEKECVLALENVGNPHNLGAIMRSCAHFGAKGILVDDASLLESGAAVRTAEGGAEHVQAITAGSFAEGLDAFRQAGYTIVTTSSHAGKPLSATELPEKMVLVLGQESDGLKESTLKQGDISLSIDGTGSVESLNVSVATGILLAEWWRQNH
ncbi:MULTISPECIES: tRNA/rRNA methyltransferase [Tatumella]|uniref:tRNA/rRNA methyltransferase n=1 Tax=Tatumella punctata TaxID=399969 RepID=A0ABW1VQN0_9GAMM|nr:MULTISPECIES: tRNA/rRNA methyltransferase [unclassified Tatumella]MBS0857041.1 tRNA/rRNA methyltransferase [Tatumella sp. JGM16]MBS0878309.1 tRNA/rRNA methyltransferase [Tatumella sp. JGM82]MBS0891798.1 tRNA/rRNA methyltransferase [Tatumella sp. JGM94]MBS0903069.1 tRNA/rRNA methyltransferase [Tatumella sp. JGM100]MBS0913784.1 tRNA/rRNA methyltransferase [Tatumella sp. JGM91]